MCVNPEYYGKYRAKENKRITKKIKQIVQGIGWNQIHYTCTRREGISALQKSYIGQTNSRNQIQSFLLNSDEEL